MTTNDTEDSSSTARAERQYTETNTTNQAKTDANAEGTDSPADEDEQKSTELEFEDTVVVDATKEEIWASISDPKVLARCVPGAEDVERLSERTYTVELTRGLSSLTISLSGEVELVELNEPDWIVASGQAYDSRSHSDFEGLAAMEMTRTDDGAVELGYKAELTFTGGAASVPTRITRRLISSDVDAYFQNVREVVEDK